MEITTMFDEGYVKQLEEENATLRSRLEEAAPWIPQWVYPFDIIPPKHADELLEYREKYYMKGFGVKLDKNDSLNMSCIIIVAEYKIKEFVIGSIFADRNEFRWDRVDRRGMGERTVRFKHAKDKIETYWRGVSGG
jgi:hypothetical protein